MLQIPVRTTVSVLKLSVSFCFLFLPEGDTTSPFRPISPVIIVDSKELYYPACAGFNYFLPPLELELLELDLVEVPDDLLLDPEDLLYDLEGAE